MVKHGRSSVMYHTFCMVNIETQYAIISLEVQGTTFADSLFPKIHYIFQYNFGTEK